MRAASLKAGLAAATIFLCAGAAPAGNTVVKLFDGNLIVPAASPVSHPKITETQEAVFFGKFTVTGTLTVDYSLGEIGVMFEPDKTEWARLPFVEQDHKVVSMVFEDKDYAPLATAAFPAAMLADVKAHHNKRAQVHLTLDVERYTVAVQGCTGEGWYTAHFVSVHTPGTAKVGPMPPKTEEPEDC